MIDILLGQGMHASVFKCFKIEDELKTEPFAVKIVRENDEEKIIAHKNEFSIMERLNHQSIVKSYEIFVNDQRKEIH